MQRDRVHEIRVTQWGQKVLLVNPEKKYRDKGSFAINVEELDEHISRHGKDARVGFYTNTTKILLKASELIFDRTFDAFYLISEGTILQLNAAVASRKQMDLI